MLPDTRLRITRDILSLVILLFCIVVPIYHLPTRYLNVYIPIPQGLAIVLILVLLFFVLSPRNGSGGKIRWFDFLAFLIALPALLVTGFNYGRIEFYETRAVLDTLGIFLAFSLGAALLYVAWKMTSVVFSILLLLMMLIVHFQAYLPGLLRGRGYDLDRLGYAFYVGSEGIYGIPFNIACTVLIMFIIFGEMFQVMGGGDWFLSVASRLLGRTHGLVAKTAVLSSFFFGMISGSPSSNVAVDGAITIPLMKKTGYPPSLAGAVEATASTGGQIMPPVMGSIAFIMAEWLAIPYYKVCLAAAIPATLYFVMVFAGVHFDALRNKRPSLRIDEMQGTKSLKNVLLEGWFFFIPIGLLIVLLVPMGMDPDKAGFWTILATIGASFLNPDTTKRLYPYRIMETLSIALGRWLTVAVITSAVGMMVGSLALSGIGVKFSSFIVDATGGNLYLILLSVAAGCFVLGFGLDSIPMYIMMTILTAPALIKIGVPAIAAHLFVIYWGMTSFITPPVCIALYVACGISGASIWRSGLDAIRLGAGFYLVPFAFVLSPALLLMGSIWEISWATLTAVIGGVSAAAGMWGYAITRINPFLRVLHTVGGVLMIFRDWRAEMIGATLIGLALAWQFVVIRKDSASGPETRPGIG